MGFVVVAGAAEVFVGGDVGASIAPATLGGVGVGSAGLVCGAGVVAAALGFGGVVGPRRMMAMAKTAARASRTSGTMVRTNLLGASGMSGGNDSGLARQFEIGHQYDVPVGIFV